MGAQWWVPNGGYPTDGYPNGGYPMMGVPMVGAQWWVPNGGYPVVGSSFPKDFSILATVRARRGAQSFLLSMYDERGVQQLGLELGLSPVFLYEDQDGNPPPERYPTFRRVNLADGKWHRVALAVEGTTVSLLVDCHLVATLPLERGPRPFLSTQGVTVFGGRLMEEEVFEVGAMGVLHVPIPWAMSPSLVLCPHPLCCVPIPWAMSPSLGPCPHPLCCVPIPWAMSPSLALCPHPLGRVPIPCTVSPSPALCPHPLHRVPIPCTVSP
uniref:Thrombospondin-like N-terminal domain-containing protein n=1 Tax=Amazona collaria TaxID=241587 RepID=A0A8B9FRY2_9PSIT